MEKVSIYNALKMIQAHKLLSLPEIFVRERSGFSRIKNLGYIKITRNKTINLACLTQSGIDYISRYEASQKALKLKKQD